MFSQPDSTHSRTTEIQRGATFTGGRTQWTTRSAILSQRVRKTRAVDSTTAMNRSSAPISVEAGQSYFISASKTAKFGTSDTAAAVGATGAAGLRIGERTLYIGTRQVSDKNQDPIIRAFGKDGNRLWSRTDYEATGADGRGYGLFWSGNALYGLFSVDGTQGAPTQDFRRAAQGNKTGWTKSYGMGGGAKATVLAKLNPTTGAMQGASYLSGVLQSGKTNSLVVTGMERASNGNLVIKAQVYYGPRGVNGKLMNQKGTDKSPFDYTLEMTADLKQVIKASAPGWLASNS
ncbi:hypothetical protein IFO70_30255 [Phormidium tenue FACHB-886]|nr:hypothetical protein [Phormidium tenue FACHB-886]